MGLQEIRSAFFARKPEAKAIDSALRSLSNPNPFFFMSEVRSNADLNKCDFTLVRLGPELERRFNINGEVAVFFSPWADFQRRSFLAMTSGLTKISRDCQEKLFNGEVRFSPSKKLAIVVSADVELAGKVAEWSDDEELIGYPELVVLSKEYLITSSAEDIKQATMDEIRRRLGERNLYRAQKPVVGDDFFGRSNLLSDLVGKIKSDQNPAIFGLRRSGKTSAVRELKRTLVKSNVIVTMVDLQMVDEFTIDGIPRSIVRELIEDLRVAKEKRLKVYIGPDADKFAGDVSVVTLADIIRKIAVRNGDLHFVLAVDEIEHLQSLAATNPGAVKSFLGALRSTAQLSPNVSLLFSGVLNRIFLESSLGRADSRVDNPMFGQIDAIYLRPFTRADTGALLNGIGAPMFVEWSEDAIEHVHAITGGSPFFVRELAADIWDQFATANPGSLSVVSTISARDVLAAQNEWSKKAIYTWSRIVEALENHYPDAAYLLSPDVHEDSLNDWIEGEPRMKFAADSLVDLGFLHLAAGSYSYTETLHSLRSLGNFAEHGAIRSAVDRDVLEVIDNGESQILEFKSTIRVDTADGTRKSYIEDAVTKTVAAFLNSDGGTLLVGVGDDGSLLGISADLSLFKNDVDKFERWILGDLLGRKIGQDIITTRVRCDFPKVRGVQILRMQVEGFPGISLVDDHQLYVRVGNQTRELKGREMITFARKRDATT